MTNATQEHAPNIEDCLDCTCADCCEALKDFNAWCDAFNERWAARKHKDCGPLCTVHGDVRDHSAVRS